MDAKNLTEASVIVPDIISKLENMGKLSALFLAYSKKDTALLRDVIEKKAQNYIAILIIFK
jgi:hypothetical protein